ncbi:MAG TPA: hypothetical protein VGP72_16775 [Planctomycetota bacterium]|jgi:pyroglutamyl-peptidase
MRRLKFAAILLAITAGISFAVEQKAPTEGAPRSSSAPVCLLTGFEPFGELKTNPSWEMLKPLAGQTIAGYKIETLQLPVVYDALHEPLQSAVARCKAEIVICFGVGSKVVQVETIARNGYHPLLPLDNNQKRPPRDEIVPGAAETLATQLPATAIVEALKGEKIGAGTSEDAGGYLCNECFYRVMSLDSKLGIKRRGFVHVPQLEEADPEGGVYTIDKLQRAVRLIVEQAAK